MLALAALLAPALVLARGAAPTPDKGDTSWMLTATILVILMTIPGLALFYGGMVRSKNMLSVLMQVFVTFCLISLLWAIYGYSFAFTPGTPFFGGTDRLHLDGQDGYLMGDLLRNLLRHLAHRAGVHLPPVGDAQQQFV